METVAVVQAVLCATAEELIQRLSPSDPSWDARPQQWIFRGHADSAYALLATAHRDGAFGGLRVPNGLLELTPAWSRRQECELWLMRKFRDHLDEVGLPIPLPVPRLRWESRQSYGGEVPHDGWPLRALAKHYGLPTELLDWTARPRNAAYFAAVGAAGKPLSGGMLDVWALDAQFVDDAKPETTHGVLELYKAPQASNPNLHAQSGLFTVLRGSEDENVRPVDQYLEHFVAERKHETKLPVMRKFSLPHSCAPKLLRLLSHEGVGGATMFPGYDGVVRSLRERALWDTDEA